jgi:hypothetical protein
MLSEHNGMKESHPGVSPSVRLHKRQLAWQVLIPFLVMSLIVIAGAVLVVVGGAPGTRIWADVAVIWLLAPLMVLALIAVVVLVLAIIGLVKLTQFIPRYTPRVQSVFSATASGARKVANGVVLPFVWFEQARAALRSFFRR